ncbi:MAG TPA: aldehyde dehydrogenase family protein [Polyangia bacterium]|nr:aldehyde dehydrogenase family protein [Polyangia bacterium]
MEIPGQVLNWIDGQERPASGGGWVDKLDPATGQRQSQLARSGSEDVAAAVAGAVRAQPAWARTPGVRRGEILYDVAAAMKAEREALARVVARETGKSFKLALGETDGAIQLALFFAGEGQRLFGRTTTSGVANRSVMTLRCPLGVAGLIMAANTPIANVAWKVFPALICGNAAVTKPPEDAPATAWAFSRIAHRAGLPPGLVQVVQGLGAEAGEPLVDHPQVPVVSFTGSTAVGRRIAVKVGERMGRVSLELGGKNALVVCDDADLDNAVKWALLSAFSNAGQRCAAGSRIVVLDAVYDEFRDRLVARTKALKVGTGDDDDLGPVINARQLAGILAAVERAVAGGGRLLCGGQRLTGAAWQGGYYVAPTVIEGVGPHDELSTKEVFGPVTCLYRVRDFAEALALANDSPYGLTASIHTASVHRAWQFVEQVQTGVVMVNAGTFGSEPHMPFGGLKHSGNGTREPGTEALDVYSSLKNVFLTTDPARL